MGFAMLASGSVQEAMDIGTIAHLCAIKSRVHFYTSLMDLELHMKFKNKGNGL